MKKQIVITLTETGQGWTGEIYGQIGEKQTNKITTGSTQISYHECMKDIINNDILDMVELWMEQIS